MSLPVEITLSDPDINYFLPGQVWMYDARTGDEGSTLTVLKIDERENDAIVHIRVDGIIVNNTAYFLEHLAFSADALITSITGFVKHADTIPAFEEDYKRWKQFYDAGTASYFKVPVKIAIGSLRFVRENSVSK